ncbi:MAG: YggS family pyridoxal phosphate-dependent enzyme [candidate division Zixibacteria bacterium]|nr:YggS family pyridoxal phosphate-dependent enzyme [candidate division Zixibacteria bacterium]
MKGLARILGAIAMIAAVWSLPVTAQAARLETRLEQRMQTAGPDEFLSVVIRPVGTLSGAALKRQVTIRYATRAEQHRAAVEALQATTEQTQPPILSALSSAQYRGRVDQVKGFWIDNVITAEMTPSAIAEIAGRPDVEEVVLMLPVTLVKPVVPPVADATSVEAAEDVEPGLKAIKADSLWKLGYTGHGRLVASIDTGVDGKHVLLSPKWRGHNGGSVRESWFDPVYGDTLPRNYSGDGATHGTNVMGIMVAVLPLSPSHSDTLGVCPDCQWISAAAINIPCPTVPAATCSNLFDAMQWVADPDGDPTTEGDVPDAVANPWGAEVVDPNNSCADTQVGCNELFWNAIDNIEAAGAAMVFAAGNEGDCGLGTIRNPANRVSSETNAFAVGMIRTTGLVIDTLSSRGPSDCGATSIKPEVVAPGYLIRTTNPSNGIVSNAYGTSFSTPHVAAAIALLREYNPNATVDQIKQALLDGARDLGSPGPDNVYGHGLLDLMGAMRALPPNTQPYLTIRRDYYVRPAPGAQGSMIILLRSSGTPATNVSVTMFSADPRLTVIDGQATFGDLSSPSGIQNVEADTSGNFLDPFTFTVADDVLPGERLAAQFKITAGGGFDRTVYGAVQVGPAQNADLFTHDAGNFRLTVSDIGTFGLEEDNLYPHKGGVGYYYGKNPEDPTQTLFEGAFLVGNDPFHVSDNARNASGVPDVDFQVDPGGRMQVMAPGPRYPQETRAAFSDAEAEFPLGLFIEQHTWVSDQPDQDDYLTVEYTIHNRSGETITGLRAGLYFDWDFPWTGNVASLDTGGYNATAGVGWMRNHDEARFRGLAVISPMGPTSYQAIKNYDVIYDGFTDAEKWDALSGGFAQSVPDTTGDGSHLIATGPFTIAPDSAVKVAFAIIGATSEDDLVTSAQTARSKYNAGALTFDPAAMTFTGVENGTDPASQDLHLANATDVSVTFDVQHEPSWGNLDKSNGAIPAGGSQVISVSAHIGTLAMGTYKDTIAITTSDAFLPIIRVPSTLVVTSASAGVAIDLNPFNPATGTLKINLDEPAGHFTEANVYDLAGEEVRGIDPKDFPGGHLEWDGKTNKGKIVADGVYLCRVAWMTAAAATKSKTLKIAVKNGGMTASTEQIHGNVRRFTDELRGEMARLGIAADSVTVVAVTKTVSPELIAAAADAGFTDFGENRVQEAKTKIAAIRTATPCRWHLIGQLQTNKAKDAVGLFDLIQSVDRLELARELDRHAARIGKRQDILIQMNSTAESQKSGCGPEALDDLAGQIAALPNLRIMGLMTIGPFIDDPAPIARAFRLLRAGFDRLTGTDLGGGQMRYCSMGMSNDWRIALAEGANMLRIGRAIFGERK